MRKFAAAAFTVTLAATGTAAFAEQELQTTNPVAPIAMTDAQMDNVAAGLVFVVIDDVVTVRDVLNNNDVRVPVSVAAAANVLTNQSQAGANSRAFNR